MRVLRLSAIVLYSWLEIPEKHDLAPLTRFFWSAYEKRLVKRRPDRNNPLEGHGAACFGFSFSFHKKLSGKNPRPVFRPHKDGVVCCHHFGCVLMKTHKDRAKPGKDFAVIGHYGKGGSLLLVLDISTLIKVKLMPRERCFGVVLVEQIPTALDKLNW